MACVYPIVRLPENCTEEQAIEIASEYLIKKNRNSRYPLLISYPGLKYIWITVSDQRTDYYEPRFVMMRHSIYFPQGARPGTVTIGGRELPHGIIPNVVVEDEN